MATFWRDTDRSPVTVQEAIGEWSLVAHDVLEEAAGTWRRTVSQQRLAVEVQKRSGIITSLPDDAWLDHVVSLVAQRAHEDGGPALTAFVVDADGDVPDSYGEVLALEGLGEGSRGLRRQHALDARLLAHRLHRAAVPEGATADDLLPAAPRVPGARASRSTGGAVGRSRSAAPAKAVVEPPKPKVCPTCYLVLPATGRCDYCS